MFFRICGLNIYNRSDTLRVEPKGGSRRTAYDRIIAKATNTIANAFTMIASMGISEYVVL
jgi:hypothetical protein